MSIRYNRNSLDAKSGGRCWVLLDGVQGWIEVYNLECSDAETYLFDLMDDDSHVAAKATAVLAVRHREPSRT